MKRIFSVLLAVLLVLGAMPLQAVAAGDAPFTLPVEPVQMYGGYVEAEKPIYLGEDSRNNSVQTFSNEVYDKEKAAQAICDNLAAYQAEFDVSAYHIPKSELNSIWQHIKDRYGELFHAKSISCYSNAYNELSRIIPVYSMSAGEYAAAKKTFDGKISAILSQMEPTFTDLQKVLFAHDYLAANFEYDVEGLEAEQQGTGKAIYDAYQFLTTGKGVCQAYTLTFEVIMDRLGIPASYVHSAALVHIWNMVEINGKWYQLDITHDDPVVDSLGAAAHTRFLVSDSKMKEIKEVTESDSDWVYGTNTECTDATYETWFWAEASSPFVYHKPTGVWYCVCSGAAKNGLCQWDGKQNDCTLVKGVQSLSGWRDNVTGKTSSFSAGLGTYRGSLFFSAPDGVYQYDLKTKGLTKLASVSNHYSVDRIHGLRISGNTLSYDYRASASNWARTIRTIELSPYTDVEGIYGWYAEDNVIYIHIPEETQQAMVMAAWYDGSKLMKTQMYTVPGDFSSAGADGCRCRLMALAQDNYRPLCEAVTITPAA